MPRSLSRLALVAALTLTGCSDGASEESSWQELAVADLEGEQAAMFQHAKDAASTLGKTMVAELTKRMAEDGPVAALEHCRLRAPEIRTEVASSLKGIQGIGRTSHKLRNAANTPPQWALRAVEAADGKPHAFAAPGGALHVLLPIPVQPTCLVCHGAGETMPEELKSELQLHYPHDQATGFQAGDLRGWFWVEVPPSPQD